MSDGSLASDAWNAATELLRSEGKLSDSQTAFIRMAHPLAIVDDMFLIGVGSEFIKNWLMEHVSEVMTEQISAILGRDVRLTISVDPGLSEQQAPAPVRQPAPSWQAASDEEHRLPNQPAPSHLQPVANPDYLQPGSSDSYAPASSIQRNPHQTNVEHTATHDEWTHSGANPTQNWDDPQQYSGDQGVRHADFGGAAAPSIRSGHLAAPTLPNTNSQQAKARLNPRYTFDNFVTGESNRFAHATALAVSESPGSTYNPLFLYSNSGMGKTHLLHAIGNYTMSLYPDHKVLYVSSEEFTNQFINALRDSKQAEFKDQFRNVDVLLIDDIQFISTFDRTVEEFFHTFNALTNANKQIVITSDVAPKLLSGFEERMISRFASGITANIDLPNLETRIAILDKKAASERLDVPRSVIEYIATRMTTNVREMEGALRRVTAFADLSKQPVTLETAEIVLKDMISDPSSIQISAGLIMAQTASYFGITIEDLKSPTRTRSLTQPRHIAMYLCREMTDLSLPKIAEVFDRRDHTTVINALRKIEGLMAEKQTIFNQVSELTANIKNAAKEQAIQSQSD